MTPPNATPTRADVLREFRKSEDEHCIDCGDAVAEDIADEVLRLRAHRDAMIRRVEALARYFAEAEYDEVIMSQHSNGLWLNRAAVLAALREGGET